MIDDFLLVLFTLQLRDNLTMKKQTELNVIGCSIPKGSKRARVQRCGTGEVGLNKTPLCCVVSVNKGRVCLRQLETSFLFISEEDF